MGGTYVRPRDAEEAGREAHDEGVYCVLYCVNQID